MTDTEAISVSSALVILFFGFIGITEIPLPGGKVFYGGVIVAIVLWFTLVILTETVLRHKERKRRRLKEEIKDELEEDCDGESGE